MRTQFSAFLSGFMKKNGYKLEYIAEMTGSSIAAIGHYKKGRRIPKYDFINKFVKAFKFDEFEKKLIYNAILRDRTPEEILRELDNLKKRENKLKNMAKFLVPMFGVSAKGKINVDLLEEIGEYAIPVEDYKLNRFVIKVVGDSMVKHTGKSIPDGTIALVDPMPTANLINLRKGIYLFNYNNQIFIKQFLKEEETTYLVSFNEKVRDIQVRNFSKLKCYGRVIKTYYSETW